MKKVIHCEDDWKVKNEEGKDNGALQHKVWKPGRLQIKNDEYNASYEQQQQNKVWDPGKMNIEGT
jgi:hypothetical protein